MIKQILLLTITIACWIEPVSACTSAVISGKITPDGRPLLWKNRDTDFLQNCVKYFSGERYPFIAIVNSVEDDPTDVWIGTNSAGCLLYTSYLRDIADYTVVKGMYDKRFPDTPKIFVHAPVCRPGWLIEMECMGVKTCGNKDYAPF